MGLRKMCLKVVANPISSGRIIFRRLYLYQSAKPPSPGQRAGVAVHADGAAGGRSRAVDDAGALSVVSRDSAHREAGLARTADLRRQSRPAPDPGRDLAPR